MREDPIRRLLRAAGRLAARRPGWVLALLAVSAIASAVPALSLEVRSSFLDLLPPSERPVIELREVLAHSRSSGDVVIAISAEDRPRAEAFAREVLARLEREPSVQSVAGHLDPEWFRDRQLLYAEESEIAGLTERARESIDRELLRGTGLFVDLMGEDESDGGAEATPELLREVESRAHYLPHDEWSATPDGRYLLLWAYFPAASGDLGEAEASWALVRRVVDELRDGTRFPRELEVRYAGGIPQRLGDHHALVGDLRIAGSVGFLAVVLLIVAALRAPRALVLLAVPLFVGLVWTFAFARIAVGHLNIISGFLFSILSGLGIEYGIHLLHGYRELRERGEAVESAVETLVGTTGRAVVSGSLTNAGVFAVVAAADFRGFSEFGLIAAVGLLLTLASTLLGLPALLVIGERIRPLRLRTEAEERPALVVAPAVRWATVIAVPLVAAASIAVWARGEVPFDGNWRMLAGSSDATRFGEYLRHQLDGTFDAAVIWAPDDARRREVEQVITELGAERRARGEPFDVIEVHTLDDVFPDPSAQIRRAALAVDLGAQLARIREDALAPADRERLALGRRIAASARPFDATELPHAIVGHFRTSDGRGTMLHLRAAETDDASTTTLVAWAEQARAIAAALTARGIVAPMLSENWIAGEIFERIAGDATFLAIGTLVAVLVVLLIDFRRIFPALAVLGSVLIGVASMAGVMWLTGVRLNFMNAAILPVCVGISLDNAIHVYHRWQGEGPGSIPKVLRHTARANALSSATNLLGFGALALTEHDGLRSVAALAAIGVTLTYLSTTVWFPMVLATLDARRAPTAPPSGR
jgi:predicted RND superfamily exporter protein